MKPNISIKKRQTHVTRESYNAYHKLYNVQYRALIKEDRKKISLLFSVFRCLLKNYKDLYP